jgi:hypothetical protein
MPILTVKCSIIAPVSDEPQYRIKSEREGHLRTAMESELSALNRLLPRTLVEMVKAGSAPARPLRLVDKRTRAWTVQASRGTTIGRARGWPLGPRIS